MNQIHLTALREEDLPVVKEIYNYYILHTTYVYFLTPLSLPEIRTMLPIKDPLYRSFLIQGEKNETFGFCYYHPFKDKPAFQISVEMTIYLRQEYTGKGIGSQVLKYMEPIIRKNGFSNIVACISSENRSSCRLFEKNGYHCCGRIKNVAEKAGRKLSLDIYQKNI